MKPQESNRLRDQIIHLLEINGVTEMKPLYPLLHFFEAELHEYGKNLQGTILDLEFDLNKSKEDALRFSEIAESKVDELQDLYRQEQQENYRLIERKDKLEEWLTEYRDQLKKENVFHKNTGIINAINDLIL